MPFPILDIGSLHFNVAADRRSRGATPAIVNGGRFGKVYYAPAFPPKAVAPVNVLAIHEKLLVEEPDPIKRAPPYHPKPAVQYVHLLRAAGFDLVDVKSGVREDRAEAQ